MIEDMELSVECQPLHLQGMEPPLLHRPADHPPGENGQAQPGEHGIDQRLRTHALPDRLNREIGCRQNAVKNLPRPAPPLPEQEPVTFTNFIRE